MVIGLIYLITAVHCALIRLCWNISMSSGLRERLRDGEITLCAEGYMWELERRGFVRLGEYTPEVVLDFPERVIALHEEFVMAGSDVVQAYTYYGHREKLRQVGREDDCKSINLKSLKMARDVADKYGKLMAGGLSNTTIFEPDNLDIAHTVADMFKEQVEWAVEGGADFMIGETFNDFQEAKLALEAIQQHGKGMPSVITIVPYTQDRTTDDVPIEEALKKLEDLGADVVGLNCGRGPATMMPLLEKVRKLCKGPLAAIPNPLRTTEEQKSFMSLRDPVSGVPLYPSNMTTAICHREEIKEFTQKALQLGIQYLGLCCCNSPSLFREMAVACGRDPVLGRFSPDHSKSYLFGKPTRPHREKIRSFMCGDAKHIYSGAGTTNGVSNGHNAM